MRHLLPVDVTEIAVLVGVPMVSNSKLLALLDQPAYLFSRLRRTVAVIQRDIVDLPTGDAALVVDHLEECPLGLRDHAIGRGRATVGFGVADLDFGRSHARRIVCDGRCRSCECKKYRCQQSIFFFYFFFFLHFTLLT